LRATRAARRRTPLLSSFGFSAAPQLKQNEPCVRSTTEHNPSNVDVHDLSCERELGNEQKCGSDARNEIVRELGLNPIVMVEPSGL